MEINVGLVGHGRWGKRHLETLIQLKKEGHVNHISVCDLDSDQLVDLSEHVDASFTEFENMLGAKVVNCIAIVTPPSTHLELVSKSIERTIPVFVEKPLSDHLELEHEFLNSLNPDDTLVTGFLLRHHEGVRVMKEQLVDGVIGTLCELHYRRRTKRDRPQGAEAMKTLAIHGFDLSLFFGFKEMANGAPEVFEHLPGQMLLDTRGAEQKRLVIDVSWNAESELRELTLIGQNGNLRLTFGPIPEMHLDRPGLLQKVELSNTHPPLYNEWMFFLEGVKAKTPTIYPTTQDLLALNQWFQGLNQY